MEKTYKFTLPQNEEVTKTNVRVEDGEIIVEVDFKEKFEPKDGDILFAKHTFSTSFFIYKYTLDKETFGCYYAIQEFEDGEVIQSRDSDKYAHKECCRFATNEEKIAFLERLKKECHKKWNADKKCLEDIYVPKYGDVVKAIYANRSANYRNYMICIYPDREFKETANFFNPPFVSMTGKIVIDRCGGTADCCEIIPASESEKQELFDKLAEIGKIWNPDTKELEDLKWEPKYGELYYYVESWGDIFSTYRTAQIDENRIKMNNYFKTEEDAKPYSNQLKEIFKN